jgi:hypothetical protein
MLTQFNADALPSPPEFDAQYNLNPALCQRTTVSGWTKISACFHPGQKRRKSTRTICMKRQLADDVSASTW